MVDNAVRDQYTRMLLMPDDEHRFSIVDIDENSLERIGAWPWPRQAFAELLDKLIHTQGVSAVALDMIFPESKPDDALFATQLRDEKVLAAVLFDKQTSRQAGRLDAPRWPISIPVDVTPPLASGFLANYQDLGPAQLGHINPVIDDGAVRRIEALICYPAVGCYPTFTLATYMLLADASRLALVRGEGLAAPAYWLRALDAEGRLLVRMPLADDFTFTVPYRHRREAWSSIPAADVLQGVIAPDALRDSPILIGGTAFGLADVIATPLHGVAAGIEAHAETFSALLDGSEAFAFRPRGALAMLGGWMALWAVLLVWQIVSGSHPLRRMLTPLGWLACFLPASFIAGLVMQGSASWLMPVFPVLAFGLLGVALCTSLELYLSARMGRGLFAQFSAYLPASMVAQLARRQQVGMQIDAQQRELTVMFVDIRNFALMSESLSADAGAQLLQTFFTEVGQVVNRHGGIVDKYIGDAVMSFWNAIDDDADHASHALAAAAEIRQRMASFPAGPWGQGGLRVGIGVETGSVLVGNFGPPQRRTFTALGDTVVLASRYEALSRPLGHTVVVGPGTADAVSEAGLLCVGEHLVRGHTRLLKLYTLEQTLPALGGSPREATSRNESFTGKPVNPDTSAGLDL